MGLHEMCSSYFKRKQVNKMKKIRTDLEIRKSNKEVLRLAAYVQKITKKSAQIKEEGK